MSWNSLYLWLMVKKMKVALLLLVAGTCITIAQTSHKTDKADQLSLNKAYDEEIKVRAAALRTFSDKESDDYKIQLYKIERALFNKHANTDSALPHIARAVSIFNTITTPDPSGKLDVHISYGSALIDANQPGKAIQVLSDIYKYSTTVKPGDKGIAGHKIKILTELSAANSLIQDYTKAIAWMEKAIEAVENLYGAESEEVALHYAELGILYSYTDNFHKELDNIEKAVVILEQLDLEDKFYLFKKYSNYYSSLKYYGDQSKAKEVFEKIKAYYEKHQPNQAFVSSRDPDMPHINPVKAVYYYVCLQHAYINQDLAEIARLNALFHKILPKGSGVVYTYEELNRIASFYFESGAANLQAGDFATAKRYFLKARQFTLQHKVSFLHLQACMMLSTLGVDAQQWDDAVVYAEEAMRSPDFEAFNQGLTINHNLGFGYYGKGEYAKALPYLNRVLAAYLGEDEHTSSYYVIQNLIELGKIYFDIADAMDDRKLKEQSFHAYKQASVMFSQMYRGGAVNFRLANMQKIINEGMLRNAVLLHKDQHVVLERVEITNSDYLWSAFLDKQVHNPVFAEPLKLQAAIDSIRNLSDSVAVNDTSIQSGKVRELKKEQIKYQQSIDKLSQKLAKAYPMFQQFSRGNFDITAFQQRMKQDEVAVKYVVTDSLVFAYVIDGRTVTLHQLLCARQELERLTIGYINHIKDKDPNYGEAAAQLYDALISPLHLKDKKSLVIVNNDFLSYLPFETLVDKKGKHLFRHFSISYSTSLRLWELQKGAGNNDAQQLIAFAPQYDLGWAAGSNDEVVKGLVRDGLYELKGAQNEAKVVRDMFNGKLFTAGEATKENFIQSAGAYNILHLAMHAVVHSDSNQQSGFLFANNEKLRLDELYALHLPADLAVLSACNTGSGELQHGEGVQSLARAFVFSGVKSTVMSLWQVPDEQTAQIMVSFYRHLKNGLSKSEALKNAKTDYLEGTKLAELKHPFYWAGFVLSGDTAPLPQPHNYVQTLIWGGATGMLVVIGMMWYRRKRP